MKVNTNMKAGLLQGEPVWSSCKRLGSIVLLIVISALPFWACTKSEKQTNFQQFDATTGSVKTEAWGINDNGCIVGLYYKNFVALPNPSDGFWRIPDGGISGFDYPGGGNATEPHKINNSDNAVGLYQDTSLVTHGFLYSGGSGLSTIDFPGSNLTEAYGINDSGTMVGRFAFAPGAGPRPAWQGGIGSHGFLLPPGGTAQQLDFAGPTIGAVLDTELLAINNSGMSVGVFVDSLVLTPDGTRPRVLGFVFDGSTFTRLPDFSFYGGSLTAIDVVPTGINDSGVIVGFFEGSDRQEHGFVFNPGVRAPVPPVPSMEPLLVDPNGLGANEFPAGTNATSLLGINNDGVMVGAFTVFTFGQGLTHGFRLEFPALMTSPTPTCALCTPLTLSSSNQIFSWSAGISLASNPAQGYALYLGTFLGGADIYNSGVIQGTSATVPLLPNDGSTIYVRLWSLFNGTWQTRDYTYKAAIGTPASIIVPDNGSTLSSSTQTFWWTPARTDVTRYWLYVGTKPGYNDICSADLGNAYIEPFTKYLFAVPNCAFPTDGSIIYVRLWSMMNLNTNWMYRDYAYRAVSGPAAYMINLPPGLKNNSSTVGFLWSRGSGEGQYWLTVGRTLGSWEIYNSGQLSTQSVTPNNLPTDGSTIFVRLYSLINGTWLYRDYKYDHMY